MYLALEKTAIFTDIAWHVHSYIVLYGNYRILLNCDINDVNHCQYFTLFEITLIGLLKPMECVPHDETLSMTL